MQFNPVLMGNWVGRVILDQFVPQNRGIRTLFPLDKKGKQTQLGVPHSEIQVEID